jgi:hypothetical protein
VAVCGCDLQDVFLSFDENLLMYLKFFDANTFFFVRFSGQKGAILRWLDPGERLWKMVPLPH